MGMSNLSTPSPKPQIWKIGSFASIAILLLIFLSACSSSRGTLPATPTDQTPVPTQTPVFPPDVHEIMSLGNGSAEDIAWTTDGKQLIVAGSRGLHFYEPQTGKLLKHLDTPTEPNYAFPRSIALSPVETTLAFTGGGGVWITDLKEGKTVKFINDWTYPKSKLLYSKDGRKIVFLRYTIAADGYASFWGVDILDSSSGEILSTLFELDTIEIHAIKLSPDGHLLAIARGDNLIHLFDMDTGKDAGILEGHESDVLDIDFSPDGQFMASVSADATLRIWNVKTKQLFQTLRGFTGNFLTVAYTPDGGHLLTMQQDGTLQNWFVDITGRTGTNSIIRTFHSTIKRILPQPGSTLVVVLETSGRIQVLDWSTGNTVTSLLEFGEKTVDMSWSSDGNLLAAASGDCYGDNGAVLIWDVLHKQLLDRLDSGGICDLAFSPNGNQIAYLDGNKYLTIWNIKSKRKESSLETNTEDYLENRIAFSPNEQYIACAGASLQVWSLQENQLMFEKQFKGSLVSLSFSPDGNRVALITNLNILLFDAITGQELAAWELKIEERNFSYIRSAHIHWDSGEPFAVLSGGVHEYSFWDINDGHLMYQLMENPRMNGEFVINADARLLAAGSTMAGEILDARSGVTLWSSEQVTWNIMSFNPDGNILAAIDYGNTIHLWDVSQVAETAKRTPAVTATISIPQYTVTPSPTEPVSIAMTPIIPAVLEPNAIQANNLGRLHEVARLGESQGILLNTTLAPGGKFFSVTTSLGVQLYETQPVREAGFVPMLGQLTPPAISPDGSLLLTSDLILWNVALGKPLYTLSFSPKDQEKQINLYMPKMNFSLDGKWIDVEFHGDVRCTWQVGVEQAAACKSTRIEGAEFSPQGISPDGLIAAFFAKENSTVVKNIASGKVIHTFEYEDNWISGVLFSPDGRTLAFSSYEGNTSYAGITTIGKGRIELWEYDENQQFTLSHVLEIREWHTVLNPETGLRFTPDGRQLVVMDGEAEVQFWDVQTGRLNHSIPNAGTQFLIDSSGEWMLTRDERQYVKLWRIMTSRAPALEYTLRGFVQELTTLQFSSEGDLFSGGGTYGQLWDLSNINGSNLIEPAQKFEDSASPFAFSSDGRLLAAGAENGFVQILNTQNGGVLNSFQVSMFAETGSPYINSLSFSRDATLLATSGSDWKVRLWDRRTANLLWEWENFEFRTRSLTMSPNDRYLAASGYEYGDTNTVAHTGLAVWDLQSGKQIRLFNMTGSLIAFHPDGVHIFSIRSDGQFTLFDLQTGQIVWTVERLPGVLGIAVSPNGKMLAVINGQTIQFLETDSGNLLHEISTDILPRSIAFSMDGKVLALACNDGTIRLFQIK